MENDLVQTELPHIPYQTRFGIGAIGFDGLGGLTLVASFVQLAISTNIFSLMEKPPVKFLVWIKSCSYGALSLSKSRKVAWTSPRSSSST